MQAPARLRNIILKVGGVLLVCLGVLHLAVTPIISRFIERNAVASELDWFRPPMLLNHVVVGILLLPLGVLTFYAASPAIRGERWALVVVRTSALSIACLPIVLFSLMGYRYFGAWLFSLATAIVCLAAIVNLVAAFWRSKSSAA